MKKLLCVAVGSAMAFSAQAFDKIPRQDSNIDFYDTSLNSFTLGMMYSF